MDVQRIRIAYTGAALAEGLMDVNELSGALVALGNLVGSANRVLNRDSSTIQVRLSADVEHGAFELVLELTRTFAEQIKLLFAGEYYSLNEILGAIGLVSTVSGFNLLELFRQLKGRRAEKVETVNESAVKITLDSETKEVTVGVWQLYSSQKVRRHLEGVLHPLTKEGVETFEARDFETREPIERVGKAELEYFAAGEEEVKEIISVQKLMLQIVSVSFEPNLKWRFYDGETKFYATITDEQFLKAVAGGEISFANGITILAEVQTRQQHRESELRKTEKSVVKVLEIFRPTDN